MVQRTQAGHTAEAFFQFIQELQKLNATQQNLVQQEVFGGKQILKASEFLHADFGALSTQFDKLGAPGTALTGAAAEKLGAANDVKDLFAAVRAQKDLVTKATLINKGTIKDINRADDLDLQQENERVGKAKQLADLSYENQKLMNVAVNAFIYLAPLLTAACKSLLDGNGSVNFSKVIRGYMGSSTSQSVKGK